MKTQIVPAKAVLTDTLEGGLNQIPRGFTWKKACQRALDKKRYRAIQLARCNPDYKILHPNECRDNPENKILTHCHPEAEKRILEEHEKMLKLAIVPPVERPQRLNKLG